MGHRYVATPAVATGAITLVALAFWTVIARAEMGPCVTDDRGDLTCGSGNGAAAVILKTKSPSKRLAFAWRLTDRPPTSKPDENDPNLENVIVRILDGAVLAKSHGAYWDLGTKIAKAYLFTAWSPDSRLLVKIEQRADSASAELFSFAEDDTAIGPFDLVKVIEPAVQAQMQASKDADISTLVFAPHPAMTINDAGLMQATVLTISRDLIYGPTYEATVQVKRAADTLDANVVSVTPYTGTSISIIVH